MTDEKKYLVCCYYYFNHIKNKYKIDDWGSFYSDIMYGNLQRGEHSLLRMEPIFWKRFYNENSEKYIQELEDNIQYCEIRHQLDVKKKEKEKTNK